MLNKNRSISNATGPISRNKWEVGNFDNIIRQTNFGICVFFLCVVVVVVVF